MKAKFATATLLLLVLLVPLASASTVTRSLSKNAVSPGETIAVTLDVAVTGGESYYLIDDAVPQGWAIVNPDPQTQAGHFKVAVIQGAASTSYSYEATAPQTAGSYAFSGTYIFQGTNTETPIGGQGAITVQSSESPKFGFDSVTVPAIIAGAAIISLALYITRYRKKP